MLKVHRIFLVIFLLTAIGVSSQVIKPFKIAFQQNIRGDFYYLANSSMTCYTADTASMPPNAGGVNDGYPGKYIDRDNDPSTFSSSSDSISLPDCVEVVFAGLYWGGTANASTPGWDTKNSVKIKFTGGNYETVLADNIDFVTINILSYTCFKNVTNLVKSQSGRFRCTVANVVGTENVNNTFAGWNLVVIYKTNNIILRQITLFNGLAVIRSNLPSVDIPVSGFKTPNAGPVSLQVGVFAYEGDRGYKGDQLLIKSEYSNAFKNIYDSVNDSNNVFNSTISRNGQLTPWRVPSLNNNFSIDADVFFPDNSTKSFLTNNEDSLVARITTNQDVYALQNITLALDARIPDNRLGMRIKDLNGGKGDIVSTGDTLEYTLHGSNVGTDKSINTYIINKLDNNTKYVPNSIEISKGENVGKKTDALKDDQADYDPITNTIKVRIGSGADGTYGGTVDNSLEATDSTVVKFRVTVTEDCLDLKCSNIINNHAFIYGTGFTNGTETESDKIPSIFDGNTCTLKEISNISSIIVMPPNCPFVSIQNNSPVCSNTPLILTAPYSRFGKYLWRFPNGKTSTDQIVKIDSCTAKDAGVYSLIITLDNKNCQSSYTTNVSVLTPPQKANAGSDKKICGLTTNLQGNTPTSGIGKWTLVKGDVTKVKIASDSSPTSSVTFNESGTYVFEWVISNGGCTGTPSQVKIIAGDCSPNLDNEYHLIHNDSIAKDCIIGINDKSVDGSALQVSVSSSITTKSGGIFRIDTSQSGKGCYSYTPKPGFVGMETVVVSVCDGNNQCANDTVFINVLGSVRKPVDECKSVTGDITPNSTLLDKHVVISPAKFNTHLGNVDIKKDGPFTYTAFCDLTGLKTTKDTILVDVCDSLRPSVCITDTIFIDVNSKPIALPDTYKDSSGDLSKNDVLSLDGPNKWFVQTQPSEGSVKIDSITGKFVYTPPYPDFQGDVTFKYRIVDVDGDSSITTVKLNIPVVFVPEGFSPNGDGSHDKLIINGIDSYPDNKMSILNRWGNKVYEAHPYKNESAWDGTNMFGITIGGSVLPIGTYFYILELGNGFNPRKGVIYLSR